MSTTDNDRLVRCTDQTQEADSSGVSRRKFLGGLGGAAAAAMTSGVLGAAVLEPAAKAAVGTDLAAEVAPTPANIRRKSCRDKRRGMADYWFDKGTVQHPVNGDETLYDSRIGNYSKSMPHNAFGEVDPDDYNSLLKAIDSGKAIGLRRHDPRSRRPASRPARSAAWPSTWRAVDSHDVAVPPPPALASKEMAGEMVEIYWMALLRDVNFLDYGSSRVAATAIADLNGFGADFKGPKIGTARCTPQTLFRDTAPGTAIGPYISQFMWLNTPFGVEFVERKMWTLAPGSDHMQNFDNWLAVAERATVPGHQIVPRRAALPASTAATSRPGSTSTSSSRPTSTPA